MLPFETKAYSNYGADMGRHSDWPSRFEGTKVHLRRVRLDSGGYDPGGAYWGTPNDLWCGWTYDQNGDLIVRYIRAPTRLAAKLLFPKSTFYR